MTPIYKDGARDDVSNYRLVSILPAVSKPIERVVHDQLYRALASEGMLSQWQSGFRPGFSATTAASFLIDRILTGMDSRDGGVQELTGWYF